MQLFNKKIQISVSCWDLDFAFLKFFSGDGGNRTRVRETVTKNFYMLSLLIQSRFLRFSKQNPEKPARKDSSEDLEQVLRYSHKIDVQLKMCGAP